MTGARSDLASYLKAIDRIVRQTARRGGVPLWLLGRGLHPAPVKPAHRGRRRAW
jgi:hypothetical protein